MILLFVTLVIAVLAVVSLGMAGLATLEHKVILQTGHTAQLVQIIQSGIVAAAQAVDDLEHPDLFDNPDRFCGIEIVPAHLSPTDFGAGRFTIFSPRLEQEHLRGIRFGLTRESAKLSLEAVLAWEIESPGQGVQALQQLPGITPSAIDSILDWLDADDNARPMGAESNDYQQQQKTYRPRNAVPVTLEELLLIRDVEQAMLFGSDIHRSFGATPSDLRRKPGALDSTNDPFAPLDFNTPSPQPTGSASAWQFLLTPYSAEKMVNTQGIVRVFLNEPNLEFLESQLQLHQLDTESIQFILAWRNANGNINDPIDLLDAEITSETETLASPFSCADPIMYERFLRLLDETVTDSAIVVRGRINVNEASRPVLEAVPELTPDMVTSILERRQPGAQTQRHAVWLLAEGIVDKETMKTLLRRLTTGGDVYRFHVAGFFDGDSQILRAEAVLDATVKPPKTVFYKELPPLVVPE